ncbi:MAG: hypothetical protein Ta2A_08450 [Treponemataceae bacterium]|nr:MAG: hypothetical protein Ta2A_08450 [Treponemataceae bacterium]
MKKPELERLYENYTPTGVRRLQGINLVLKLLCSVLWGAVKLISLLLLLPISLLLGKSALSWLSRPTKFTHNRQENSFFHDFF